jgi:hypothetical protein
MLLGFNFVSSIPREPGFSGEHVLLLSLNGVVGLEVGRAYSDWDR